jgi:hypothetical protein
MVRRVEGDDLDLIAIFDVQRVPKPHGRRDLDDRRRMVALTSVVPVRPNDEGIEAADGARHDAEGNGALGRLHPSRTIADMPWFSQMDVEAARIEDLAGLGHVEVGVFRHPVGEVTDAAGYSTPENRHAPVSRRTQTAFFCGALVV